jgi:hypothetical protein
VPYQQVEDRRLPCAVGPSQQSQPVVEIDRDVVKLAPITEFKALE